jgi:hypothetical protein
LLICFQIGSNCDPSSVSRTGDDERSKSLPPIDCSRRGIAAVSDGYLIPQVCAALVTLRLSQIARK